MHENLYAKNARKSARIYGHSLGKAGMNLLEFTNKIILCMARDKPSQNTKESINTWENICNEENI